MLVQNSGKTDLKGRSPDLLTCDWCNSNNIIETLEGFVCKNCGLVLELEKLEYYAPYSKNSIQSARLNEYTNIGTYLERSRHPHFSKLKRFQKQQLMVESKKQVVQEAKIEIGRIFSAINYPDQLKEKVFILFKNLRKKIKERSKYRSAEKLVPISIYLCCKLENVPINEGELLEASKITKQDFNAFKLQVYQYLPEYKARDRQQYVQTKLFELMEHFNLEMGFYFRAQKVLEKLWNGIKNTSDLVIAGVLGSISLLCSERTDITVNALCRRLGIRMSTVQAQVKKHIFDRFNRNDFVSLMASSKVLKEFMVKLGVIEENNSEIKLGNAVQAFNRFEDYNYCVYLISINSKYITLTFRKKLDFEGSMTFTDLKNEYDLTATNYNSLGIGPPRIDPG